MGRHKKTRDDAKARVELRFDVDLYNKVRMTADAAGISVNQLLQGVARWAMEHANVGNVEWVEEIGLPSLMTHDEPGCVWFDNGRGEPLFTLDFSERYVVHEIVKDEDKNKGGTA